jgi:hypothetical protein
MKYGIKLVLASLLPLVLVVSLLLFVAVPHAALRLHGQQNHLTLRLVNETGFPIKSAIVRFALRREVPIIPVPFAPTRFITKKLSVDCDEQGIARLVWPNMSLTAQAVIVAGEEIPIAKAGWTGSVTVPTPDGRSTWDAGTNYAACLVVNRIRKHAELQP